MDAEHLSFHEPRTSLGERKAFNTDIDGHSSADEGLYFYDLLHFEYCVCPVQGDSLSSADLISSRSASVNSGCSGDVITS